MPIFHVAKWPTTDHFFLPVIRRNGRRCRARWRLTGKCRRPMRDVATYEGDFEARRYWLGPLLATVLVDDGMRT